MGSTHAMLSTQYARRSSPPNPVHSHVYFLQLDLLKAYHGGQVLSEQVTELKSFISAVADAELDGDDSLLAITAAHTAAYAVQLIKQSADPSCLPCKVCSRLQCPVPPGGYTLAVYAGGLCMRCLTWMAVRAGPCISTIAYIRFFA